MFFRSEAFHLRAQNRVYFAKYPALGYEHENSIILLMFI